MSQEMINGPLTNSVTNSSTFCLLSVGSNVTSIYGDPRETVVLAAKRLRETGAVILKESPIYRTPAFPPGSGPDFANAAWAIETEDAPDAVLKGLHRLEASLGRTRSKRWEPRVIDIDLLAYGDRIVPDAGTVKRWLDLPLAEQQVATPDEILLPHPRMHERAFVLVPLSDIAPQWRHPLLGVTVQEMREALPVADLTGIAPYD
jgi:2-amino-4-hydroxy-6-hydroxymethyldihydropteridine diphosphokinase